MTERENMERGDWYDPGADAELRAARHRASDLCHSFNQMLPSDRAGRLDLLRRLFGHVGDHASVLSPLQVDYGYNVPSLAFRIQQSIKHNVESMTKYKVDKVDVHIQDVNFPENAII